MAYTAAVIIPTLNEEKFIAGVLDSVISQNFDFQTIEVLVVDGGSKDRTCEIVEDYHSRYDNIRLLHNPKRIQSAAFNLGVKESTAPYVIRLDAHALYDKDYIRLCIEGLKSDDTIGNVGGMWRIRPQAPTLQAEANAVLNQVSFGIGGSSFRVGAKAGFVDTVPFGSFRRDVINAIGGMREDLPRGEDNEYNSRLRQKGYKIFFNPAIVSDYFARKTIGDSCRQMYANGLSIGHLLRISPSSVGLRHLVPFLFVASIVVLSILSAFSIWALYLLAAEMALYILAAFAASYSACRKFGFKFFLILPLMFLCVHLSYGVGTFCGLIKNQ